MARAFATLAACFALFISGGHGQPEEKRTPKDVRDPDVVAAAEFAMKELRELSDSGIYRTLELDAVLEAATGEGVFHENTFLKLRLRSPHFRDGAATADHEVMVMKSYDDGAMSFAIDEFPTMDDDAIEQFWIQHVEEHRRTRDKAFEEMEEAVDSILRAQYGDGEGEDADFDAARNAADPLAADELQRATTGELLQRLQHPSCNGQESAMITDEVDRRYEAARLRELLRKRPTRELRKMLKDANIDADTKATVQTILDQRWRELEALEAKRQAAPSEHPPSAPPKDEL